jgi:hypothetical protein
VFSNTESFVDISPDAAFEKKDWAKGHPIKSTIKNKNEKTKKRFANKTRTV